MLSLATLLALSATPADVATADVVTLTETHQNLAHWTKLPDAVPSFTRHQLVLAVKHSNLDQLEKELYSRSTPGGVKYGKHMTFDAVDAIISTRAPAKRILAWARSAVDDMSIIKSSPRGEYIRIEAPVSSLEKAFGAKFAYFKSSITNKVALRTDAITLPKAVHADLHAVFRSTDFPPTLKPTPIPKKKADFLQERASKQADSNGRQLSEPTNTITPSTLNSFYNVGSNAGSASVSQAVFETSGQTYSPDNLQEFQQQFQLPTEKVATDFGGHSSSMVCEIDMNSCAEANLDVQYMMGMSQSTPMTYYYEADEEDPFLAFVEAVSKEATPPDVNSISYGSVESEIAMSTMKSFNTEAMKLGLMGSSVFVSSGDDGVANYLVQSPAQCAYNPSYPATSPYVTAVGATYSASWGTPGVGEIVCQANKHDAVITSGGGFSSTFDMPAYQKSAVNHYFNTVATQPASGYAQGGRGYPDVALSGFGYEVVIGEDIEIVCGTSCSSPTVAGMVSLINAIRVEAGGSTTGFLNPALYQAGAASNAAKSASPFNDVVSGENQCTANGVVCCTEGFYAAPGWDPTTGFGSLDYAKLKSLLTSDLDQGKVKAAEARLNAKAAAKAATPKAATPKAAEEEKKVKAAPLAAPKADVVAPVPVVGAAPTSTPMTFMTPALAAAASGALLGSVALLYRRRRQADSPALSLADNEAATATLYNVVATQ